MQNLDALHRWDVTPAEARQIQKDLAEKIDQTTPLGWQKVRTVLAVDVSMNRFSKWMSAAAVVCNLSERKTVGISTVIRPILFPYVPGLLSFREVPPILEAIQQLTNEFDAIVVDGQGVAHPRGIGLASHFGLWLNRPAIGVAKSRLHGTFHLDSDRAGTESPLIHKEKTIGRVLITKNRCKPVFVSVGHLCRLEDAVSLVKMMNDGRRIVWPIRAAHDAANAARRAYQADNPTGTI